MTATAPGCGAEGVVVGSIRNKAPRVGTVCLDPLGRPSGVFRSKPLGASSRNRCPPPGGTSPNFLEEFDPGSERTLAAWLRHASRTDRSSNIAVSGERVSNAWVTYPELGDNSGPQGPLAKVLLIPDEVAGSHDLVTKGGDPQGPVGLGAAHVLSASWRGNGSPRLRRVAGLRGRPATSGLRHCPDTYGWLQ